MKHISFLLPRRSKLPGILLVISGAILAMVRFYWGVKPEFLNVKVFAIYSSFLQSKSFEVIQNQILEEIAGVLILSGLFMVAFAREETESYRINVLRLKSFFISAYLNTIFLLTALIFTFGIAFIYMMIISLISWLGIYVVSFRILMYKENKKSSFKSERIER
jgi:hypothetical protein